MVSKLIGICMGRMHCFYFHKSCLLQIVFPNGSIDPWHALGIVRNVSATEQAVYIQGMKKLTGTVVSSSNICDYHVVYHIDEVDITCLMQRNLQQVPCAKFNVINHALIDRMRARLKYFA